MNAVLRQRVCRRARSRCEYCHFPEKYAAYAPFHIEHVLPKKHGGGDTIGNLALACHHCNLFKGPNLSGIDSKTGRMIALFNPRRQSWQRHFRWNGPLLIGRTAVGRTTIGVLEMNHPDSVKDRESLMAEGKFGRR